MLELSLGFIIIAMVLLSFTLIMVGLSVIPWCSKKVNKDKLHYTASWSRLAIPEHDGLTTSIGWTTSIPPLPPYLFKTDIEYDSFLEYV